MACKAPRDKLMSMTHTTYRQNGRVQNKARCSFLLHGAPLPGAQTSPLPSPCTSLQLFDSQSSFLVQVAMSGNFSTAQKPTVVSKVPFVQEKMQLLLRSWKSAGAVQFPPSSTGPPPRDNSSLPELSTIDGGGGGRVPPARAVVHGGERATTGWRIGAAVGTEGAAAAALLAAPLRLLPLVAGEGPSAGCATGARAGAMPGANSAGTPGAASGPPGMVGVGPLPAGGGGDDGDGDGLPPLRDRPTPSPTPRPTTTRAATTTSSIRKSLRLIPHVLLGVACASSSKDFLLLARCTVRSRCARGTSWRRPDQCTPSFRGALQSGVSGSIAGCLYAKACTSARVKEHKLRTDCAHAPRKFWKVHTAGSWSTEVCCANSRLCAPYLYRA